MKLQFVMNYVKFFLLFSEKTINSIQLSFLWHIFRRNSFDFDSYILRECLVL